MKYFFFDLGNVLVHFDAMIACQNIARLVGRDQRQVCERQVFEALYDSGLEVAYERGEMDDETFAKAFCESMGVRCATIDLLNEMAAMFTPNQAILPVIARLRGEGIPLGVLSNTCAAHWNWVQRQQWDVSSGWFRDAVLSYEAKSMKPEAEIYQLATRIAGVPPHEIFFTDDRQENVDAAKVAGWHAELFIDAERLITALDHHATINQ